ncbi:YceI family protein [Pollutibacter soli]|uniref:YceI family protein n=1 Tax=Pollutibacter soli TaxID=3034157 RepID=UPI0030132295
MYRKIVKTAFLAAFILGSWSASAQTKWTVDKGHSNVKFTVTHMTVSEVEGNFKVFDGSVEHTKPDFSDAKINFTVDVASVNTDNERRDGHLKSDDFFNAEKFPQMKFVSKSFKPLGNNKYELSGDLTIRDITKPITFAVTYGGTLTTSRGAKAGFKAKGTINRFDYNLKWDRATEAGGLVVEKNVDIQINLELDQAKPQTAAQ